MLRPASSIVGALADNPSAMTSYAQKLLYFQYKRYVYVYKIRFFDSILPVPSGVHQSLLSINPFFSHIMEESRPRSRASFHVVLSGVTLAPVSIVSRIADYGKLVQSEAFSYLKASVYR